MTPLSLSLYVYLLTKMTMIMMVTRAFYNYRDGMEVTLYARARVFLVVQVGWVILRDSA